MFKDIKVTQRTLKPDLSKFTKDELKMLDDTGISRHIIDITIDKYDDDTYKALRDIINNQYKLPMKYIDCVFYRYAAYKRNNIIKNEDEKGNTNNNKDVLIIEPLNNNYEEYIRYIPINQSLPLDTNIVIDIDTSKYEPNYYYFTSNTMKTDDNIEDIIKKERPDSITLKPWLDHAHIGSLDIDSKLTFKGRVRMVNQDIFNSFCLFNFRRDDEKHYFTIYTFDCFNITPKDILELMLKQNVTDQCKAFCKAVLSKLK